MLKSKFLPWVIVLFVVVAGGAAVLKTGSISPFSKRPSVKPLSPTGGGGGGGGLTTRQSVPAPPPGRPPTPLYPGIVYYRGPIGDFLVTSHEQSAHPPCPEPRKFRTQRLKTSELYSPMFGENPEVVECGNGKIITIGIAPAYGRTYFVGTAKVPWDCIYDRLVLLTVGGHPAIVQLPHPACWGMRMAVIQRFPSSQEPGILVWLDPGAFGPLSSPKEPADLLKEAAAQAAQIMGVQP